MVVGHLLGALGGIADATGRILTTTGNAVSAATDAAKNEIGQAILSPPQSRALAREPVVEVEHPRHTMPAALPASLHMAVAAAPPLHRDTLRLSRAESERAEEGIPKPKTTGKRTHTKRSHPNEEDTTTTTGDDFLSHVSATLSKKARESTKKKTQRKLDMHHEVEEEEEEESNSVSSSSRRGRRGEAILSSRRKHTAEWVDDRGQEYIARGGSNQDSSSRMPYATRNTTAEALVESQMLDDETATNDASARTRKLEAALNGTQEERLHEAFEALHDKLGSLVYNCHEDLFAWTRAPCSDWFFEEGSSWYTGPCAIILMIFLYGFGVALFFMHLQYMTYCDEDKTTLEKANKAIAATVANANGTKVLLTSCSGWASECKLYGTTLYLKDYLQYRAAAYILLLVPFLYIPFMVITSVNHSVADIIQMLMNAMESDPTTQSVQKQKQKLQDKKDRFDAMDADKFNMQEMGHLVGDIMQRMDYDGHSWVLLLLFFLFHGVMGGISLFYDGSLYVTMAEHDDNQKCARYQTRLNELSEGAKVISMDLKFLAMWQLIWGIVLGVVTVTYLLVQCRTVMLHRARSNYTQALDNHTNNMRTKLRTHAYRRKLQDEFMGFEKKLKARSDQIANGLRGGGYDNSDYDRDDNSGGTSYEDDGDYDDGRRRRNRGSRDW
jgi:hypothetical protein